VKYWQSEQIRSRSFMSSTMATFSALIDLLQRARIPGA